MNEELFYCACWRELQYFLSDLVIRDTVYNCLRYGRLYSVYG